MHLAVRGNNTQTRMHHGDSPALLPQHPLRFVCIRRLFQKRSSRRYDERVATDDDAARVTADDIFRLLPCKVRSAFDRIGQTARTLINTTRVCNKRDAEFSE